MSRRGPAEESVITARPIIILSKRPASQRDFPVRPYPEALDVQQSDPLNVRS
jgi:hypothetical protein